MKLKSEGKLESKKKKFNLKNKPWSQKREQKAVKKVMNNSIMLWHVYIGIMFSFFGNFESCLHAIQSNSYWLIMTQSRVLRADWLILILENNEKATLHMITSY